jgi:cobalt-zinc-cadmium efflux system protein
MSQHQEHNFYDEHGAHSHEHHHGGSHNHGAVRGDENFKLLIVAGLIALLFTVLELLFGIFSHSTALIADSGHMFSDSLAILAGIYAHRLARRDPGGSWTYGFKRAEIMSAEFNGLLLIIFGFLTGFESIVRIISPVHVETRGVIFISSVGIIFNLFQTYLLGKARHESLNSEGLFRHSLTDMYGFIGTLLSALIVVKTGFVRADSIASLCVVLLMLKTGVSLLRQSGRILMEAAPQGIDIEQLQDFIKASEGVISVQDLHVWTITSELSTMSASVLMEPGTDCHVLQKQIEDYGATNYNLKHVTIEILHSIDVGPH